MISVTLLTGFLGSGKTTLVSAVLADARAAGLRVGVVVNDLGAPGVDAETLVRHHAVTEGDLVNLSGGSVGGTLGGRLTEALGRLAASGRYDRLLVETSGTTDPAALLDAIAATPGVTLARVAATLDTFNLVRDYDDGRALFARLVQDEDAGTASPELLLARQIQAADLIVLTKPDLAGDEATRHAGVVAQLLNPVAEVVPSVRGNLPPGLLLPTHGANAEAARARLASSRSADAADAGLTAAVVSDPRPFHPERLHGVLQALPRGLFRAKGVLWLASRPADILHWNLAGARLDLELAGYWKASLLDDARADRVALLQEERAALEAALAHPVYGDRTTELVLIGVEEAVGDVARRFREALCTPAEVRRWQRGGSFRDPWPTRLREIAPS
ncbi:MAG: GTP-binding protein [Bacteroidota bacterium]